MKKKKIKNFLDIETVLLEKSQVAIIPFGFEATTTYGQGADLGPEAILQASSQVELFDEELWQETNQKISIATLPVKKPAKNILLAKKQLGQEIAKVLKLKKIPITLGGEHSITPFIIEAYKKSGFGEFSILHFDAHADLRDGYLGQPYSHAAAMRRCLDSSGINPHTYVNFKQGKQITQELDKRGHKYSGENNLGVGVNLVQVGIRNISNENDELVFWKANQARIKTFGAKDKKSWQMDEIIKSLKEDVYISFDVDALDPSIMPSTGTPEPGGLDWFETIDILRAACQQRNIIGADFVELAPIKNFPAPDFLVAKLIYKTIGYIFNK